MSTTRNRPSGDNPLLIDPSIIKPIDVMPRIFQSPTKWSSPRTKGGVHNRNGFAVMRFNGRMKATGLKFHADNK